MMILFLLSMLTLGYITVRYSRYRNIVIQTQLKLLKLSREVSELGIYHENKPTIEELLNTIDNVIYNVPNTNIYVTLYLVRTKEFREQIKLNFDKKFEEFSSDILYVNTMGEIKTIVLEHQKKFHSIEMKLLSKSIRLAENASLGFKSKKQGFFQNGGSINKNLNRAENNAISGILAY